MNIKKCKIHNSNTTHNLCNLTSYYFKNSFNTIPICKYIYPLLKLPTSTPATFNTPLPFNNLYNLANQYKLNFTQLNNTPTYPK